MDPENPPAWLEIALTVDPETAEAVAEVMTRYIPDGVVIESTQIIADPYDEGRPVGSLRVFGFLPVDQSPDHPKLEETKRRLEEALWYLGRIRPIPAPEFKFIQEADWSETWKQHYHPIPIGQRLIVIPSWIDLSVPERIPLRVDPGMAFGTGTHPTTRLCLEAIENLAGQVEQPAEFSMIDVGCGSGILAIAALKLGFGRALGVDNDSQAIPVARQNATENHVSAQLELGVGSVAEIRQGVFGLRRAPLVMVNILAPIIIRLLDEDLADLLEPDGIMVLSGILDTQITGDDSPNPIAVLPALQRHNLVVEKQMQIDDWVALVVKLFTSNSLHTSTRSDS